MFSICFSSSDVNLLIIMSPAAVRESSIVNREYRKLHSLPYSSCARRRLAAGAVFLIFYFLFSTPLSAQTGTSKVESSNSIDTTNTDLLELCDTCGIPDIDLAGVSFN